MLELQVRMTCPHCLPSAYLLFCLLLTCHLPKTPDIISHWPCLRQTLLFLTAWEGASHKHLTQLLPYILMATWCMCWQMLLCGFQCVYPIFLLPPDVTYPRLKTFFHLDCPYLMCLHIPLQSQLKLQLWRENPVQLSARNFILYKFKIKWPYNKFQQANGKDLYGSNRKHWFLNATNH